MSQPASAQNPVEPRREQLLNGLKVLIWSEPKNENITIKLRIHSGSAFDPVGKEGTMRLLADILFPEEGTRQFFAEELGGKLEIVENYDYIEITASGKADQFEEISDVVKNAVTAPPITPDTFKKVRDMRVQDIQKDVQNPGVIADQAVRKRLYGDFPYGRAMNGTAASLAKIDHNDLIFARDRFLTADNATLAIIGNVKEGYALRAARQFFGSWRKADKLVPATFRQPETPSDEPQIINSTNAENVELRLAMRGVARNDKDYAPALVAAKVIEKKWGSVLQNVGAKSFVKNEPNLLPGIIILGASIPAKDFQKLDAAFAQTKDISDKITAADAEEAKTVLLADFAGKMKQTEAIAEAWLDLNTFKLGSLNEQILALRAVTFADVKRVGARLFKDAPKAGVVVLNESALQKSSN